MKIDLIDIIAESKKAGLDLVSYTNAEFLYNEFEKLRDWQNQGFAAEMAYMNRPAELLCDPKKIFSDVKSILVFALYYERSTLPKIISGYGRVARYAWGKDYHQVIRQKLKNLVEKLSQVCGSEVRCRAFSDSVPLLERAIARDAGLGFVGKNSMLIRPKTGSYFFIAEILSNLEIRDPKFSIVTDDCGTCNNCIVKCPTDAIISDRVVNSSRCISYLTIEKRGMLDLWERKAIGEWVFGCDLCQEVCPFNHRSLKLQEAPSLEEFKAFNGAGGLLNLDEILNLRTNKQFAAKFSETALMRTGRTGLLRNAAFTAANTISENVIDALVAAFYEDSSEVVRASAFWSLSKLNRTCNIFSKNKLENIHNRAFIDCEIVRNEMDQLKQYSAI